jgi:hypothetical protein
MTTLRYSTLLSGCLPQLPNNDEEAEEENQFLRRVSLAVHVLLDFGLGGGDSW